MKNLLTVPLGAALLLWPAIWNHYPILYSDTGGFLEQALMPDPGWDKPWIYGPFLTPLHLRLSLWPAAAAQAILLSTCLWLVQQTLNRPARILHLAICLFLAVGSAAPWFASLLMPDIFAPITLLALFTLAYGHQHLARFTLLPLLVLVTIAIASHPAHLILAAACIATLTIFRWRSLSRTITPLVSALALILFTNLMVGGVSAISPYGADFALARLVADGPARDLIDRKCPGAGYHLCAWKFRLPTDSDDFLWDPHGPVWADGYGPIRLAPEAAAIVRATILAEPGPVLVAALRNTFRQLGLVALGDTLSPVHLEEAVTPRLQAYFPPAETVRFHASAQAHAKLETLANLLNPLDAAILVVGTLATVYIALTHWRRERPLACLATLTLVGLLANAFATGALSGPHDRYQARIAWLVLLPPAYACAPRRQRRSGNS